MDETNGASVGGECFDIHAYDDNTDHLTMILVMILVMILMVILMMILMMMVGAGTEDRSQEHPYPFPPPSPPPPRSPPRGGGVYKFPGFGSRLGEGKGEGKPRCSNTPQDPRRGRRI